MDLSQYFCNKGSVIYLSNSQSKPLWFAAYFKQLPSAKAARGCLRFFIGLGRVLLEGE